MLRRFSVAIVALGMVQLASADLLTLNPTADARILSIFPNTNYTVDFLPTYSAPGNVQRTVILFDLDAIPAGAAVDSARLRLNGSAYFGSVAPTSVWAYRVITPWVEAQVT